MGHAEGDGDAQQGTEKQAAESDVGIGAFLGSGRGAFDETGPQTGGDFSFQAEYLVAVARWAEHGDFVEAKPWPIFVPTYVFQPKLVNVLSGPTD